jgi:hypothetical protein
MHRPALAALLCLLPSLAPACDTGIFACTFNGGAKRVDLCVTGADLTYTFGPPSAVELRLVNPLDFPLYTPWNGIGSSLWETVIFQNEDIVYEVWTSQQKMAEGAPPEGGINVLEGEQVLAELTCDPGSVMANFEALGETLYARGMCWDATTGFWTKDGC